MSKEIEFYYNELCPFFMVNEFWKRAESSGNANMLFYDKQIAREITALYNFHSFNFIKVINRSNKILIRTDIAGSLHDDPTLPANDGTGTRNQEGTAVETSNSPPFSWGLLWPLMERYKSIHLNQYSESDQETFDKSIFSYPSINQEEARKIRESFNQARESDGGNPGSYSYSLNHNNIMSNYGTWPKKLMMAPDSDYKDGNLFENYDFTGTSSAVPGMGVSKPNKWNLQFDILDTTNAQFCPKLETTNGQQVVSIKSGYDNINSLDVNPQFWDWYGIYQNYICTPHWKRENSSPSRYRHEFSSLSGESIINHPDNTGFDNEFFDISENYFWNMVYKSDSISHTELWETDRNTDEELWFNFDNDGTVSDSYGSTTKIRHEFGDPVTEPSLFKQYFSRFNARTRKKDNNWYDWEYLDVAISEDTPLGISPNFFLGEVDSPTIYEFQMGQRGGRGKSFVLSLEKENTSCFLSKYIDISDLDNRKIYSGDWFQYEINIDSSSVDNNFGIRLGLVENKSDLDSEISYTTIISSNSINDWEKVHIDLSEYVGKFVRRIEFVFSSSNSTVGKCLAYFNEVQFINNYEKFSGRQFMISARYKTDNLESPVGNIKTDYNKPHFKFSAKLEDQFGNTTYKLLDMHYFGESNSQKFTWIKGAIQIPAEHNLSEIIVGVGIYKNIPSVVESELIGPYGTVDNGGSLKIERLSLEPTSRLYLAGIYSLDTGNGNDDFGSNNFIPIESFGWKAWALQILAKYFEAWDEL